MPSWQPMTSGSSECHTHFHFFYLSVSVHVGAPVCRAMWINNLYVRLRNTSPGSHGARAPQRTNNQTVSYCVIVSAGRRDNIYFWWVYSWQGEARGKVGWAFSQCVDGLFCGLMHRSNSDGGVFLVVVCACVFTLVNGVLVRFWGACAILNRSIYILCFCVYISS